MSASDPTSWLDRIIGMCVGVLVGAVALYAAVQLIAAILPWLIGFTAVAATIWLVVVIVRRRTGRW